MKRIEIINALMDLFKNDEELFNLAIEELDSYNGYLYDDRYYDMESLDEIYYNTNPTELLTRAFYGYDEMHVDGNDQHTEAFNPNREYFRYNCYGNLVSTDIKDYSYHLDNYFIESLIDNYDNLYLPDEITQIIESEEPEESESI